MATYGFDKSGVARVVNAVRQVERGYRNAGNTSRKHYGQSFVGVVWAKLADGNTITARYEDTPGSGSVTLQYFENGTFHDEDETTEIYNGFTAEITADGEDKILMLGYGDGELWVVGENCDA